eukprot:TRINITY_DN1549_c0_g1_i1.p1 TRINITY_DN1549_c0_g1~~TRINITY_DN1549_c0_g1_i1.p1  ORF type:complete len:387 (-),score=83.67 TRINITY_DN1549_c0_g1_i1:125-1180(-)
MQALEQATSLNAIHSLLAQFLPSTTSTKNDPNGSILLKLYSNALLFAKQLHFTPEKTSTFFSILKLVHFRSLQYPSLGLEDNFSYFKNLLVDHSIQRPPYSVQIFSLEDVKSITDYVTHTYFRHFKLYRYVFTKKRILDLKPQIVNVETAPNFLPLCEYLPESHWQQMLENSTGNQEGKLGETDEGKEGVLPHLGEEILLQRSSSNVHEHISDDTPTFTHSASHVPLRLSESRPLGSSSNAASVQHTPHVLNEESNKPEESILGRGGEIGLELSKELTALASTAVATQLEKLKADFDKKLRLHEAHLAERLQLLDSKLKISNNTTVNPTNPPFTKPRPSVSTQQQIAQQRT